MYNSQMYQWINWGRMYSALSPHELILQHILIVLDDMQWTANEATCCFIMISLWSQQTNPISPQTRAFKVTDQWNLKICFYGMQ